MSQSPLFSVLIANYNNGKYLMDAINSVRQQTYNNWEIILVDDGSTDNSLEIYRELERDKRIHIYYNEQNKGCGYTKRRCAELAQGEICGFLDPDDALIDDALDTMIKIHNAYPSVSIIYSKAYYCDADFKIIGEVVLPDFSGNRTYFDNRWAGCMSFASFKKVFYKKTEGINSKAKAGVDQDLYFKMEEVGKIYVLDKFTYYYVIKGHEESLSTKRETYSRLWYWNLEVRRDACIRRKKNVDDIIQKDFEIILRDYAQNTIINNYSEILEETVKVRMSDLILSAENKVRSSASYRLGRFLLMPYYYIKSVLFKR